MVPSENRPPYYVGDEYNPNSAYGYIRRVVLVKNQTSAEVNLSNPKYYNNTTPMESSFFVDLNYTALLDRERAPHYWIEPPKEKIVVNLTNVQGIRNESLNPSATILLNNIRIRYVGELYDGSIQEDYLPIEVNAMIDDSPVTFEWGVTTVTPVNSTINITFPAGYFIPPSAYANITLIKMKVFYDFNQSTVNISPVNNTYYYLPGSEGFSQPYLNPAILEVRVW
jgi:hypothetical protein